MTGKCAANGGPYRIQARDDFAPMVRAGDELEVDPKAPLKDGDLCVVGSLDVWTIGRYHADTNQVTLTDPDAPEASADLALAAGLYGHLITHVAGRTV